MVGQALKQSRKGSFTWEDAKSEISSSSRSQAGISLPQGSGYCITYSFCSPTLFSRASLKGAVSL